MASNRLEFTGGLVKLLALNVSFAVKLLTKFAAPFCMLCSMNINFLFLISPNTGSFHGTNVSTLGRKLSSFCPLVQKLQLELPNLHLKKRSWKLAFMPQFHPRSLSLSGLCSALHAPKEATQWLQHMADAYHMKPPFPLNMAAMWKLEAHQK